jgi:hypothetical protein
MTEKDLRKLKGRFTEYVNQFYSSSEGDNRNIALKAKYTHNVCKNIEQISSNIDTLLIVQATAIFHNIDSPCMQYTEPLKTTFPSFISVSVR